MKVPFSEEHLKKVISRISPSPSKGWTERVLASLRALSKDGAANENKGLSLIDKISNFLLFPNFIPMKKVFTFAVIIAVLGLGYYQLSYNSPINQVDRHLSNAKSALAQLDSFSKGGSLASLNRAFSLITVAQADEETEQKVATLVETVSTETDESIEAAEEIGDAEETVAALADIDEVQDETLVVLSNVVEVLELEEVVETVTAAIENTAVENEELEKAHGKAKEVAEKNKGKGKKVKDKVKLDVKTDLDDESDDEDKKEVATKEEKQTERLDAAKEFLAKITSGNLILTAGMQKKSETIQSLLETCSSENEGEDKEEKCQSGKIKGLTTALAAQVRNEARKQEREREELKKDKENKRQDDAKKNGDEEDNEDDTEDKDREDKRSDEKSVNVGVELEDADEDGEEEGPEDDEDGKAEVRGPNDSGSSRSAGQGGRR